MRVMRGGDYFCSNFCFSQSQAIANHKHTAKSHRSRCQHRDQETHRRSRNQDDIVEKRPKQILLDGSQSLAGE